MDLRVVFRLLGHPVAEPWTEEAAEGVGDDAPSCHVPGRSLAGGGGSAGAATKSREYPLAQRSSAAPSRVQEPKPGSPSSQRSQEGTSSQDSCLSAGAE